MDPVRCFCPIDQRWPLARNARIDIRSRIPSLVRERTREFLASDDRAAADRIQTAVQAKTFIHKMQNQLEKNGFCYFAVDKLDDGEFIGFIGLSEQNFEADFTPCIDIGWRIHQKYWGKGIATESGIPSLKFGFEELKLEKIIGHILPGNEASARVLKKLNFEYEKEFEEEGLLIRQYAIWNRS